MANVEFDKLKAKWYGILKKKGFEDIEKDENSLKEWSINPLLTQHSSKILAKAEYYRLAGHFLHDYTEFDERTKLIWELHCEAITVRDIVLRLKKSDLTNPNVKDKRYKKLINKTWVNNIIKGLAKIMVSKYQGAQYEQE